MNCKPRRAQGSPGRAEHEIVLNHRAAWQSVAATQAAVDAQMRRRFEAMARIVRRDIDAMLAEQDCV